MPEHGSIDYAKELVRQASTLQSLVTARPDVRAVEFGAHGDTIDAVRSSVHTLDLCYPMFYGTSFKDCSLREDLFGRPDAQGIHRPSILGIPLVVEFNVPPNVLRMTVERA
jgi:hypothetical protein